MDNIYKKSKKSTVQLTSLLDLLFVMIFVSLLQQKTADTKVESKPVKVEAKVETQKVQQTKFSVSAVFQFYGTNSNPNLPSGKYLMEGRYNKKDGKLSLGGVGWIDRPKNYDMVPLSGMINGQEDTFVGRIESIGCNNFTLKRKAKNSGSPIAGEWIGTYDCSQGATGLTLSIK